MVDLRSESPGKKKLWRVRLVYYLLWCCSKELPRNYLCPFCFAHARSLLIRKKGKYLSAMPDRNRSGLWSNKPSVSVGWRIWLKLYITELLLVSKQTQELVLAILYRLCCLIVIINTLNTKEQNLFSGYVLTLKEIKDLYAVRFDVPGITCWYKIYFPNLPVSTIKNLSM